MEKMTIKKAHGADAPLLAKILNDAMETKLTHSDASWGDEPFTNDEALRFINTADTYVFYIDGQAYGTVSLSWSDDALWSDHIQPAGYIHRLAVRRGHKGFGAIILQWAEQFIRSKKIEIVRLNCNNKNDQLKAYYLRSGYEKVGTKLSHERVVALLEKNIAINRTP